MMTKNAFLFGMGLGIMVGSYLIKNCPTANKAYDSAEQNIKCKVSDIKYKMHQKKQEQSSCCNENQNLSEEGN